MLKRMHEFDFVEPKLQNNFDKCNLNFNLLSKNDRLIELMEDEKIMIDVYYQFQLSLKQKEVIFPKNRVVAIKHMQSLKKIFDRDTKNS